MTTGPRIYKSGDFMILVFDQSPRTDKAHTVSLPINEKGFGVLVKILSDRERSPFVPKEFMATDEAPIQHMVDEWLKTNQIKKPKQAAKETITLEDIGL